MKWARLYLFVATVGMASVIFGCAGKNAESDPAGRGSGLDDRRSVTSHSTGEQCVAVAQSFVDAKDYSAAIDTLKECEEMYGVTVQYVPTFPE